MTKKAMSYAKAFIELSADHLTEMSGELENVCNLITAEDRVWRFLLSPISDAADKENAIRKICDSVHSEKLTRQLLLTLSRNHDLDLLPEITEHYQELMDERYNVIRAAVCYAHKPKEAEREQVKKLLESYYPGKKCKMTEEIDSILIDGFVVKVGNMIYDRSVEGKLHAMEMALTGKNG